ncbi:Uncharacterised protein [Mycobacteroides abscessus subsp. abscessus]|nr:Uncharacterised protein [Mycobacteroides abscessus subsp. abscessus]
MSGSRRPAGWLEGMPAACGSRPMNILGSSRCIRNRILKDWTIWMISPAFLRTQGVPMRPCMSTGHGQSASMPAFQQQKKAISFTAETWPWGKKDYRLLLTWLHTAAMILIIRGWWGM